MLRTESLPSLTSPREDLVGSVPPERFPRALAATNLRSRLKRVPLVRSAQWSPESSIGRSSRVGQTLYTLARRRGWGRRAYEREETSPRSSESHSDFGDIILFVEAGLEPRTFRGRRSASPSS